MKDHNLLTVRVDTVNKGTLNGTILLAPGLLGLRLEKKRGDRTLRSYFDSILVSKRMSDHILILFFFQKGCLILYLRQSWSLPHSKPSSVNSALQGRLQQTK